ncbi:HNH endonuclease (plasmid) [Pontibacillus sp. ALD_SL1]|uniref:RNA-guided endonuclease IscB n=1 Tax=Pontibacillus sp. ALD_SL1 TaxID=2777185 RepID=UPI001A97B8D5|nr:RNA-guided endonuclease IscB [Pontibacillus sp. ALD_SL1]QST02468.1 HNH endonuclease [Pontibacillus sp. ALD_SL1]
MVFVLNKNKKPLHPCSPAKARKLLKQGKAVVHKKFPFTIRLKEFKTQETNNQSYRLKVDPGSKTTGISIVKDKEVVFLGEIHHKTDTKQKLESRRSFRRGRRTRKTRYRPSRFSNRKRQEGWLAPSLMARVDNILSWVNRFKKLIPIQDVSLELVKFDLHKMQNPEISGVEYQQGELLGYEVREYLLEKFNRGCVYCHTEGVPLEIEHVQPKSRGGSNRVSNLTLACRTCNEEKDNLLPDEWIADLSKKKTKRNKLIIENIKMLEPQLKKSLKDATVVNATRWKLFHELKEVFKVVECGSGARTKMQRINHSLPKEHYYDATCVGESTPEQWMFKTNTVLQIKAKGRGSRYRSGTNKYGFPIRYMPKTKYICGFQSGDMVKALVPRGKYKGTHFGTIAMRSTGRADIKDLKGKRIAQGIDSKFASVLQRFDGYSYSIERKA